MNYIRTIVSGKKKRYIDDTFNLDLTYITPRIIAMAFPGSGITSLYRNKLSDVADFLNKKHSNNYLVINLSGYEYNIEKFNKVIHKTDWLDHHSPPLELLFELIDIIHNYLLENKNHIIVVNCNAGKGRTGTLICCYLLFSGRFNNINDAFDYYSLKRFNKGFGVTHASQKRYVEYFYQLINQQIKFSFPYVRKLTSIKVSCIPYENITQYIPNLIVSERNNILFSDNNSRAYNSENKEINFNKIPLDIIIKGDILIELFSKCTIKKKKFGRVAFNTSFLNKNDKEIKFTKHEIDPYKFSIKPHVQDNYYIKIFIKKIDENCNCDNINGNICDKCKKILEDDKILFKYEIINEVVKKYNPYNGKLLLFGDDGIDDVDEIFKKRDILNNTPNIDRRDQKEIEKDGKCYLF